jgi:PAS domain S-box-containing protein
VVYRMQKLSITAVGVNSLLFIVFVGAWAGLVPTGGPLPAVALGLFFAASLVSILMLFRARAADRELETLRTSEARLNALFQNSPICMDAKDSDGRYLLVNKAYCDWLNKTPEEILGRSNADVYASDPVRRANVVNIERRLVETGELWTQQIEVVREGKAHQRLLVKFPIRGDDGEVSTIGTCAVDLTVQKEVEDALDRERERALHLEAVLREAIMAMPAPFAIFDEHDRLVICNSEIVQNNPSFRDDPEMGVGRTFRELLEESVQNGITSGRTPDGKEAFIAERMGRHRKADGMPFEMRVGDRTFITTETQMPQGGTIMLRQDVTEIRRLERERQEAEDLLRNLFDNLDQGITIQDRNRRIVRANKAAADWGDLPTEDAIGKTLEDLLHATGPQQDTSEAIDREHTLMEERQRDVEMHRRVMPDGTTQHLRLSRFPIVGSSGEVLGLGAMGYDVTELIETEEALLASKEHLEATVLERTTKLRTSERRFRNLAQASADWFWECDADLNITYLSHNFPIPDGMSHDDLIGTPLKDYQQAMNFSPEVSDRVMTMLHSRQMTRDMEFMRPVGDEIATCRIIAMPIFEAGVFTGYTGSTADISELSRARHSLVEADRLASLGSLVAGVAHEINTPIGICVTAESTVSQTARKLQTQMKEGGGLNREEFANDISTIAEGTELVASNLQRAARLVSSFKSVAVDQTSETERNFNLLEYVQEVVQSLSPQLSRASVTVDISGCEDLDLYNYPGALAQILTNLVMNSIIHGFADRTSGRIDIRIARENGLAALIYRDDGCGMSSETVRQIFDPFFTTRRGQGGSGLGMHILFNLVAQTLKGTVQCQSEIGSGAEFVIRFPV